MASTLNTETFLVKVQYSGKRKPFNELFKTQRATVKKFESSSTDYKVEKIATKSIRSADQQAIREVLRQAVIAAGYEPGNTAKKNLEGIKARVDYASRSNIDNVIISNLHDKHDGLDFSIYFPHVYTGVIFAEPNLHFLSGWYIVPNWTKNRTNQTRKHIDCHRLWRRRDTRVCNIDPATNQTYHYSVPHNKRAKKKYWREDWSKQLYAGEATLCLSDPNIVAQIAEYLKGLDEEILNKLIKNEKAKAEEAEAEILANEKG